MVNSGKELYSRNLKLLVPFFDSPSIRLQKIEKVDHSLLFGTDLTEYTNTNSIYIKDHLQLVHFRARAIFRSSG